MADPKGKHNEPYCWHRILYALMRWTFPAACTVLVVLLSR